MEPGGRIGRSVKGGLAHPLVRASAGEGKRGLVDGRPERSDRIFRRPKCVIYGIVADRAVASGGKARHLGSEGKDQFVFVLRRDRRRRHGGGRQRDGRGSGRSSIKGVSLGHPRIFENGHFYPGRRGISV